MRELKPRAGALVSLRHASDRATTAATRLGPSSSTASCGGGAGRYEGQQGRLVGWRLEKLWVGGLRCVALPYRCTTGMRAHTCETACSPAKKACGVQAP
jgi:hypothetical protein